MRHKLLVAAVAALAVLALASTASAYYLLIVKGSGSGSATLAAADPSSALVLHAKLGDGLAPGGSEPITVTADNPMNGRGVIDALAGTVTDTAAGCDPSWFVVTLAGQSLANGVSLDKPVTVPPTSTGVAVATGTIAFTDSGSDQSACESSTVTVSLTSTANKGAAYGLTKR